MRSVDTKNVTRFHDELQQLEETLVSVPDPPYLKLIAHIPSMLHLTSDAQTPSILQHWPPDAPHTRVENDPWVAMETLSL